MGVTAKYFNEKELQRLTPPCSLQDMSQTLMTKLDSARELAGIPFVLTCGYRSVAWEKSKGRTGTSSHTKGLAVDILCNSSATRYKVIKALLDAGFPRIGVGKNFIHADIDTAKSHPIIFHYYDQ